jgi:hypothetical protein
MRPQRPLQFARTLSATGANLRFLPRGCRSSGFSPRARRSNLPMDAVETAACSVADLSCRRETGWGGGGGGLGGGGVICVGVWTGGGRGGAR